MQAIERLSPSDLLYKYQSLATDGLVVRACKSISENYLYWADPTGFNDPFDCQPAIVFEGSVRDRNAATKRTVNAVYSGKPRRERRQLVKTTGAVSRKSTIETIKDNNKLELSNSGVCCLSEHNDNILMWSHYGDNHSGLCLGFQISDQAIDFARASKVAYSEFRPVINLIHDLTEQNIFNATMLTKSKQWSYESEWRMIERNILKRERLYPPSALVQVIFGARTKPDDCSKILSAIEISGARPKLLKAEIDETRFKINLVEL